MATLIIGDGVHKSPAACRALSFLACVRLRGLPSFQKHAVPRMRNGTMRFLSVRNADLY